MLSVAPFAIVNVSAPVPCIMLVPPVVVSQLRMPPSKPSSSPARPCSRHGQAAVIGYSVCAASQGCTEILRGEITDNIHRTEFQCFTYTVNYCAGVGIKRNLHTASPGICCALDDSEVIE